MTGGAPIGTVAAGRVGSVGPGGGVALDGGASFDWFVAADDRWHVPAVEPAVRQRRVEGTPVVETALRVPTGDIVQRAYAAASSTPVVVLEVANESRLPVAIGLSRPDVRAARPLSAPPPAAPTGVAAVFPLAHGATVRVVLAGEGGLDSVPGAAQVVRGWRTHVDRGARVVVPDERLAERLVAARCDAFLDPPPVDDPVAVLLGLVERCRLGDDPAPWVEAVAAAAVVVARRGRRQPAWDDAAALEGAAELLRAAGDERAGADADRLRDRWPAAGPESSSEPDGIRFAAWLVRRLVRRAAHGVLLFGGYAPAWRGSGTEAHDVPCRGGLVSAAVRWHGARPALLWEADPAVTLQCGLDPAWSSGAGRGDALLRPPPPEVARQTAREGVDSDNFS